MHIIRLFFTVNRFSVTFWKIIYIRSLIWCILFDKFYRSIDLAIQFGGFLCMSHRGYLTDFMSKYSANCSRWSRILCPFLCQRSKSSGLRPKPTSTRGCWQPPLRSAGIALEPWCWSQWTVWLRPRCFASAKQTASTCPGSSRARHSKTKQMRPNEPCDEAAAGPAPTPPSVKKASSLIRFKNLIKWNAVKALSISGEDICQRQANPVRVHAAQPALSSQVERDDHDLAVYEVRYRISNHISSSGYSNYHSELKNKRIYFLSKRLKT